MEARPVTLKLTSSNPVSPAETYELIFIAFIILFIFIMSKYYSLINGSMSYQGFVTFAESPAKKERREKFRPLSKGPIIAKKHLTVRFTMGRPTRHDADLTEFESYKYLHPLGPPKIIPWYLESAADNLNHPLRLAAKDLGHPKSHVDDCVTSPDIISCSIRETIKNFVEDTSVECFKDYASFKKSKILRIDFSLEKFEESVNLLKIYAFPDAFIYIAEVTASRFAIHLGFPNIVVHFDFDMDK